MRDKEMRDFGLDLDLGTGTRAPIPYSTSTSIHIHIHIHIVVGHLVLLAIQLKRHSFRSTPGPRR
jgi:hypothetical protein